MAVNAAVLLDRMPPIGLAEIAEAAALQTRVDRKYLLTAADADLLLRTLSGSARVLQVDGRREARYTSVYFDTPELDAYRATAHRRRRRFKVRTRSYLDTTGCFVEVKSRNGRGVTVKQRIEHPLAAVDALPGHARRFVSGVLAAAGIDPSVVGALDPVLRTDYRRVALYLPDDGARLTLDDGLTWRRADRADRAVAVDDLVVLESKSTAGRSGADRLLWSAGHRPARLSKYATGLAMLHPDLPANRWHRTLQRLGRTGNPVPGAMPVADRARPG